MPRRKGDEKHHLIIEQEVTNAVTDIDQLSSMAIKSKEALGVERLKVVADAGYCNAKEIKACEEAGIEAYTPKINTSNSTKKGLYGKEQFTYDATNNCYHCPARARSFLVGSKGTKRGERSKEAFSIT